MPKQSKMAKIASLLNRRPSELLQELYIDKQLTAQQISDWFFSSTGIIITTRSLQRLLKSLGLIRSYSQAFTLAIQTGRKSYQHLKKKIKSSDLRKGINLKIRYQVLKQAGGLCALCGTSSAQEVLVIDHIIPIVAGGKNELKNLRVLCRACNHGKMLSEERL